MSPQDPEVSVVVPVYKGALTIGPLVRGLAEVFAGLGRSHETILVNDGSPDDTWEVITQLVAAHENVVGISFRRNFGQHNALLAGIRAARGPIVVTMDADLQHPPTEIPKLLAEIDRGQDVVYGFPARLPHSMWRNIASWLTKTALQKAIGAKTARKASAFRAFRTSIREAFERYQSPSVSIDALLTWGTSRFSAVTVEHRPRTIGESNYNFWGLLVNAMTMMTGFSVLPLRLATFIGFIFVLFGFGVLAVVLGRFFIQGGAAPGFPFLASTIAIFSGAQLFAIGIIGEYLARIHVRTMDQPAYLIAEVAGRREA